MPNKADGGAGDAADLAKRKAKALELAKQIRALFPEAHGMPKKDRRRSVGRLGKDESTALQSVIRAMELRPELFAMLADEDEGGDPSKLETALLRDRFIRRDDYSEVAAALEEVASVLADEALNLGALVVPVTRAAYEIAKPASRRIPELRETITPALDYYAANAAAALASREANKTPKG